MTKPNITVLFDFLSRGSRPWYIAVMALIAWAVVIFTTSCAGPTVQVVEFEGAGSIRTDGDAVMADGDVDGSVRAFAKGSGFPVYFLPIVAGDGLVWVGRISTQEFELVPENELPAWAEVLLDPED